MKTRILIAGVILVVAATAVVGVALVKMRPAPVEQPLNFNHQVHVQKDITCNECHRGSETGQHSTLPSLKTCLLCHKEPQGTHPDEPKIRQYAEEGREIPWKQVNRVEGHVYFSHAAHVKYGKMQCSECHGDMRSATEPVTVSQIDHLTMSACMECHTEKKVSNDCLVCHK